MSNEQDTSRSIHALEVEMAELKGQILTEIRHISHDIKNIMQAMPSFISRTEHERAMVDVKEKMVAMEVRTLEKVAALEKKVDLQFTKDFDERTWLSRQVRGAWIGGAITWALLIARETFK